MRDKSVRKVEGPAPADHTELIGSSDTITIPLQLLLDLAEEVWKLDKYIARATAAGETIARTQLPAIARSLTHSLDKAEVRSVSHDGETWVSGMVLRSLDFVPSPGLLSETIVETIRPSILFKGRIARVGQVIVGSPQPGQPQQ